MNETLIYWKVFLQAVGAGAIALVILGLVGMVLWWRSR
jgi:hypothetical protein